MVLDVEVVAAVVVVVSIVDVVVDGGVVVVDDEGAVVVVLDVAALEVAGAVESAVESDAHATSSEVAKKSGTQNERCKVIVARG